MKKVEQSNHLCQPGVTNKQKKQETITGEHKHTGYDKKKKGGVTCARMSPVSPEKRFTRRFKMKTYDALVNNSVCTNNH